MRGDPGAAGDGDHEVAPRRRRAGSSTSPRSASSRFGSQRRPSSRSTVVTISTRSWVTREVGRREPDEGHAGDDAGAAEQRQRGEAVVLRLPGGGDGAGGARPARAARRADRSSVAEAAGRRRSAPQSVQAAAAKATSTRMRSCACRRSVPSSRKSAPRPEPRERDEAALEDALALERAGAPAAPPARVDEPRRSSA